MDKGNGNETRAEVLGLIEKDLREKAAKVRDVQIPQKVGMAAAARIAADRLPRHLVALVQAQVSDGRLAAQWEEIKKRTGGKGEPDEVVALATLLVGQVTLVKEWLAGMANNNEADAHRLEGQAVALENEAEAMAARVEHSKNTGEAPARREEGERPVSLLEARRGKAGKEKRSKDAADA